MKIGLADVDGNSMARELLPYRLQEKQQIMLILEGVE